MYIGFEDFQERSRDFCFSSFLTKPEIIKIIVQVKPRQIYAFVSVSYPYTLLGSLVTKTTIAKIVVYRLNILDFFFYTANRHTKVHK